MIEQSFKSHVDQIEADFRDPSMQKFIEDFFASNTELSHKRYSGCVMLQLTPRKSGGAKVFLQYKAKDSVSYTNFKSFIVSGVDALDAEITARLNQMKSLAPLYQMETMISLLRDRESWLDSLVKEVIRASTSKPRFIAAKTYELTADGFSESDLQDFQLPASLSVRCDFRQRYVTVGLTSPEGSTKVKFDLKPTLLLSTDEILRGLCS